MILCNENNTDFDYDDFDYDDDECPKYENLKADLVIKTTKREALDYSYFSLGGYEVEVKYKGRIQFDFDCMEGCIVDSNKIVFSLNELSNCFDEQILFEDFKNISNWIELNYMQDIENGESEVQEEIEVLDFIIFNNEGEEYMLPDNVIEMINSCIKERLK